MTAPNQIHLGDIDISVASVDCEAGDLPAIGIAIVIDGEKFEPPVSLELLLRPQDSSDADTANEIRQYGYAMRWLTNGYEGFAIDADEIFDPGDDERYYHQGSLVVTDAGAPATNEDITEWALAQIDTSEIELELEEAARAAAAQLVPSLNMTSIADILRSRQD